MNTNKNTLSFQILSKYRSVLMGISILSIILLHFANDCVRNSYNLNSFIINYRIYIGSCGVDTFLFLSGVGLYYSFKKNAAQKEFYKKRCIRILIPYFLIATPAWIIKDLILADHTFFQMIKNLLFISFFESGVVWFWYIFMILICYFIFPYVFPYIEKEDYLKGILNMFGLCVVFSLLVQQGNPDLFSNINIALLRFPVFLLGGFAGKASYHKVKISNEMIGVILSAFLLMLIRSTSKPILSRYILGMFGVSILICIAILLEVLEQKRIHCSILKKILEWFGNYSLELYLTHIILRPIMARMGYGTYRIRYECLMIILAIIFSYILKKISNYLSQKFLSILS